MSRPAGPTRAAALCLALVAAACAPVEPGDRYARWEADALSRGLLRTETAPADAPYTNEDLARNFARIALHREFPKTEDPTGNPSALHKWRGTVRVAVYGSPTDEDLARIETLTDRIGKLTGLEFAPAGDEGGDIRLFFLGPSDRDKLADALRRDAEGAQGSLFLTWLTTDENLCVGLVGHEDAEAGGYSRRALIGIPTEVSPLMRASCVDEEFVQSLGLFNDHPDARPSIFNDDEEFALLTEHDEYLLRILYDPRLKPGMTAEEAMPIVRRVIAEIRPGGGAD